MFLSVRIIKLSFLFVFRYELGVLSLRVDVTVVEVANSTGPFSSFLDLDLWAPEPFIAVGGGTFSGCVLEGARVPLSHTSTRHTGVQWGQCSLPDGRNCSKLALFLA